MINFNIKQATLQKALNHMRSVFAKKSPISAISHLLIDANNNTLSITATDIEMTIKETITDVKIISGGKTLLPAATFNDIVNALQNNKQIRIEVDNESNKAKIVSGKSEYTLPTLDHSDFPIVDDAELKQNLKLKAEDFIKLSEKVTITMSNDEVRPFLNGAFFHTITKDDNNYVCLVATDGHKLAKVQLADAISLDDIPNFNGIIIPKKCVFELQKLMQSFDDVINVSFSDNLIRFSLDKIILWSRLISGQFPDYEKAIPILTEKKLTVNTLGLLSVIDRVSIVCEKGDPINFKIENKNLVATCLETNSGSYAKEDIDIDCGYNFSVSFNSSYIRDICDHIDQEELELFFGEPNQAVLIRGFGDDNALFVLMPIRS